MKLSTTKRVIGFRISRNPAVQHTQKRYMISSSKPKDIPRGSLLYGKFYPCCSPSQLTSS